MQQYVLVTEVASVHTTIYSTHTENFIKIFIGDQVTQANRKHKHLQCRPQTFTTVVLKVRSRKHSQGIYNFLHILQWWKSKPTINKDTYY